MWDLNAEWQEYCLEMAKFDLNYVGFKCSFARCELQNSEGLI